MPVTSYSRTPASNNSAPPNGWPEGQSPGSVNNSARQLMTDIVNEASTGAAKVLGTVAGTNTITAGMSPALTAYSAGMTVVLTPANTNTGAVTIAINGLTALDVFKNGGVALNAGDLVSGVPAYLVLDSGSDDFYLLNPQSGGAQRVVKSADETVNNSAVLQDDDHLTMTVAAGTYAAELVLAGTAASGTPGLQIQLTYSGAFTTSPASYLRGHDFSGSGTVSLTTTAGLSTSRDVGTWSNTATGNLLKLGGLLTLTGGGTLKLQWAQAGAHASNTVLKAGSYLQLTKIA